MSHEIGYQSLFVNVLQYPLGKAGGVAQLMKLGFTTPPSLVVSERIFEDLLTSVGVEVSSPLRRFESDFDYLQKAQRAIETSSVAHTIAEMIIQTFVEWNEEGFRYQRLILRSSASVEDGSKHSYAGVFASRVADSPEAVEAAVREVWGSVLSPRAMAYFRLSGLTHLPSMALLLQPFLEADRSGVMFTRFPGPEGREAILIEHVAGDCEQLVSGAVTPDRLWLEPDSGRPLGNPNPRGLADPHVAALAAAATQLESALGAPQDVEWCIQGERLYFLQTRPITATGALAAPLASRDESGLLLRGVAASPGWASGPVHGVFNIADADRLEPGQVLVTPMTNPDMVPAMRNAVAVVTDVGGMICHAAIVSRELGIPCVVGTEHASQDLAEGTVVTVDGSRGLILAGERGNSGAETPVQGLSWQGLWDDWLRLAPSGAIPLVAGADGLESVPARVAECVLDPAPDLLLDACLLPRDGPDGALVLDEGTLLGYLTRVAGLAARQGLRLGMLFPARLAPMPGLLERVRAFPELFFLQAEAESADAGFCLAHSDDGQALALVHRPDAGVCAAATARGRLVLPLAAVGLAGRPPGSPGLGEAMDQAGVFGRMPGVRLAPMPAPARRGPSHALLPDLAAIHRAGPPATEPAYEWLDLRPEVVISPMLKSLVAPGMELIPHALGFAGLPPLYVKWIQCRMHFRKDSFFPLWMQLRQATWDRPFLAGMLARTRASYQHLARAAARFPRDGAGWQAAPATLLADCFVDWWRAFAEFFSLSFFIQAQGDDCVYPWLQARLDGLAGALPTLPGLDALAAPASPVLTAEYLADLGRLRVALEAAGARERESALAALESSRATGSELAALFDGVRQRWFWMRERDPFFPPYDSPAQIVDKALKTQAAGLPDYPANARQARLALGVLSNLAQGEADRERLVYALGYGHALVLERENHHVVWLRESYPLRALCLEWERRLAQVVPWTPGDIFFLEAPEALALVAALPAAPDPASLARLRNRRHAYERETRLATAPTEVAEEDDYI